MKAQNLPLLLLTAAYFTLGQSQAAPDPAAPKPPPKLDLFDGSLYSAEPFLDYALLLPKEKYDAVLAAKAARKSDPKIATAKTAEASASGEAKEAARKAKQDAERVANDALKAAFDMNLSAEAKTLIESLNRDAKKLKKQAASEAGLDGLTKLDPQFEEIKKKAGELEREHLKALVATTLSESQKSAIAQAKGEKTTAP